ncbi:MAG TPA: YXWGXW repeat-containing protein [Candidatus Acidoferrum sp.]|nr:YXWGXW repeat-containing protein [Candidatus Acidoferrum sp.]
MRKVHLVLVLALFAGLTLAMPPASSAQIAVGVSVHIGPPPLRVVAVQPMCPGPGYLWTPGYWAYGSAGYYWVPGAWVMPPQAGLLWTPGYWGWGDGVYVWHRGYWGPHVGFYGGINYGFGYFGTGFVGGHWQGGHFFYNTAVWHVNTHVIHNVYVDRTVVRDVHVNRVSYNGGRGGIVARPTPEEARYRNERHFGATPMQARHEQSFRGGAARGNGFHSFQPPRNGGHEMARPNERPSHGDEGRGREGGRAPQARPEKPQHQAKPQHEEKPQHGGKPDRGDRGRG